MRCAFIAAAALALAGCQLNFDGARCNTPKSTAECPTGQACGIDKTCSVECAQSPDSPACNCPDPGKQVVADPTSASVSGLKRTGAAEPPECRFKTLTDALAAANALGTPVTVKAVGGSSGATVSFGSVSNGEVLPLTVFDGVTLTSDSATSGASYEVVLDDINAGSAVVLNSRAALSNFSIRNVAGVPTKSAVVLQCDNVNPDPVSLDTVTISASGADAGHTLGYGLIVNAVDSCGIIATNVTISGAAVSGLHVDASNGTVATSFSGGAIRTSGQGIYLRKGALTVTGTRIELNSGFGVRAGESTGDSALDLEDSVISTNEDTGLAVLNNRRLLVLRTTVYGNSDATSWTSGPTTRKAGGIVLWGNPPPIASDFQFEGNLVYSNKGDQVLTLSSGSTTWNIDGAACGPGQSNLYACYDTAIPPASQPNYRGVVALDSHATARYGSWANGVPTSTNDFSAIGAATVDATGTGMQYCPVSQVICSAPP